MKVNDYFYPIATSTDGFDLTRRIDSQCYSDMPDGLEQSICYSKSQSPLHPFHNVMCINWASEKTNDGDPASPSVQKFYVEKELIKIALQQSELDHPDTGMRGNVETACGTNIIMSKKYDSNADYHPLYRGMNWWNIVGRLSVCYCGPMSAPTKEDTYVIPYDEKYHYCSFDHFRRLVRENPGRRYILLQVFIEDVSCATADGQTKTYYIRPLNLNKETLSKWTTSHPSDSDLVQESMYHYATGTRQDVLGGVAFSAYDDGYDHQTNGLVDNCWPVWNYGYGNSGRTASVGSVNSSTGRPNYGANLIYGIAEDDLQKFHIVRVFKEATNNWEGWSLGMLFYNTVDTEANFSYLLSKAACYGILFNINWKTPNDVWTSSFENKPQNVDGMIIPLMEENGCYNGRYEVGSALLPATIGGLTKVLLEGDKNSPWELNGSNNPIPEDGSEPNIEDNEAEPDKGQNDQKPLKETEMGDPSYKTYGIFTRTFMLNKTNVQELSEKLTTIDETGMEQVLEGLAMWGTDPINALIDLRLYPFDVRTGNHPSSAQHLYLGAYDTEMLLDEFTDQSTGELYLGHFVLPKILGNFLDYEPYTQIKLYIPYVGEVELTPSLFVNKDISVKMYVDFMTGACTAVVFADNKAMLYKQGVIGISMPMTANDAAQQANGIIGNLVGAVGKGIGAVVSGATGNLGAAVTQGISATSDIFNMIQSANKVEWEQTGTPSPSTSLYLPQYCYLTIIRPKSPLWGYGTPNGTPSIDKALYGEAQGFATAETLKVGELNNGICYGKLGILQQTGNEPIMLDTEKEEIRKIVNSGFYLSDLTFNIVPPV